MKYKINVLLLLIAIIAITLTGCQNTAKKAESDKPAIVMVAFGTSVHEARKVFDYIDNRVKEKYPDHDIRWAFTSSFIAKKLKRQGIITKNPREVAIDLKNEGIKSAVFQSLHVAPGQEFREIVAVNTSGLEIAVGKALLTSDADISKVVNALKDDINAESANVIACHGNEHHPEFNKQLLVFAEKIESQYDNVFVCSVEGQPGIDKLENAKSLAKQKGSANYIPLMIVAGDHIMNDVVGDEAESWKNSVKAKQNFRAKSLGYNDKIIDIYLEHLSSALKSIKN